MESNKKTIKQDEVEIEENKIPRRDFMKKVLSLAGGLVTAELVAMGLVYYMPRQGEGDFGGIINAGLVDDFPAGSVTPITKGRFYISRLQDGGFLALYQRCTHLGCTVPWEQEKQKFVCPCHSAEFDSTGEVLAPPAPRAMDIFALTIEDGQVLVDTSKPISRDHHDALQVVYA